MSITRRRFLGCAAGAVTMVAVHAVTSGRAWPVDLVATGLAGTLLYVAVLAAVALTPTERGFLTAIAAKRRTRTG